MYFPPSKFPENRLPPWQTVPIVTLGESQGSGKLIDVPESCTVPVTPETVSETVRFPITGPLREIPLIFARTSMVQVESRNRGTPEVHVPPTCSNMLERATVKPFATLSPAFLMRMVCEELCGTPV
ncbi:hypothetical protein D3C87_1774240 [compost metagenome]